MYENKKIFILGFAKSGYEVAKVLANKNNYILINDGGSLKETDKEKYEELKNLGVNFVFNSHPDDLFDESYDLLIKNPGISIDHKYVLKANKLNIPVVNEVEVAYNLLKDKNVKIIAITGTNGKTTTTTLVYEMLKKDKFSVHLAGNIGFPLCSILDKVKENDIIVTEISCQQLENMHEFNPNVAVMTNISEAHLEFMKTFEHYKYVKSKLLKNQTKEDVAILNYSDEILKEFSKNVKSKVKWYSSKEKLNGSYILNDNIYYYDELIISLKDIKLRGIHNYENIMASIMAVKEFNCSNDSIKEVLENFYGVEHRLELKRLGNFYMIDDAYNSNPVGAKGAVDVLGMMPGKKIIVTPGMIELGDKEDEYNKKFGSEIAEVADYAVLIGERHTKPIYEGLIKKGFDKDHIIVYNDVREAYKFIETQVGNEEVYALFENDLPDSYNE